MKTEVINKSNETFQKVKDVFESNFLKKLRISRIYKALKMNMLHDKKVVIKYSCDQSENREILADIKNVNEHDIQLANAVTIPIHAIKEIKF